MEQVLTKQSETVCDSLQGVCNCEVDSGKLQWWCWCWGQGVQEGYPGTAQELVEFVEGVWRVPWRLEFCPLCQSGVSWWQSPPDILQAYGY